MPYPATLGLNIVRRRNPVSEYSLVAFWKVGEIAADVVVYRFSVVGRHQFAFDHIKKPSERIAGVTVESSQQSIQHITVFTDQMLQMR